MPIYTVNTFYAVLGGYVIDVNTDGTHGVVVAMQDQGFSNWYDSSNKINDSSNHDINGGKFRNWRLPSRRELNLIYLSYSNGGNPANLNVFSYWSSSEFNHLRVWTHTFSSNSVLPSSKFGEVYEIRSVRAF